MEKWWINFPWRVIQTNFSETDTLDFDADVYVEELKSFHCNAVLINAGGMLASYPTKLADHPMSDYIQDFDLKGLVEKCHENDIKVIARTDFSKMRRDVYERHPDWAFRTKDGDIIDYNGYVHTCLCGGFQGGYMDEIIQEMLEQIPFDGIYCNMGTFNSYTVDYSYNMYGACYCENCQRRFREKYGFEIPQKMQPGDPAGMAFARFQMEVSAEQKTRITKLIHSINPDVAYCSVDYTRQEANTEFGRRPPQWQYHAASNARTLRGMGGVGTSCDTDMMGFFHRYVSVTPALQELRLWQSLANFAGLDYYVMGRLDTREDKSAYERVEKVFAFAQAHEDVLYGVDSVAKVLMVRDAYAIPHPEERGWIRALTELHISFDEMLSSGLGKKDLSAYQVVILPEKNRLQPPVLDKLKQFAEAGGCVLWIGQTGVAPENFGLVRKPKRNDNLMGATFRLDPEDRIQFPDFEDRNLVVLGKTCLECETLPDARKWGKLLLPQRFGPPELCYATEEPTEYPAVVEASCGAGKNVYIPWYPGTAYYQDGYDNSFLFMKDVLMHICGCQSIGVDVSPMVEVTHGRKDNFNILHFVNGTGHFGVSYFDPVSVAEQTVAIAWDKPTAVCENIGEPGNVCWELSDGKLRITVPKLGFHTCILVRES